MISSEHAPLPLAVLRLRGTQAEMGAQQGAILRALGGYERTMHFYPEMAARMLAAAAPRGARRPLELLLQRALAITARHMERSRRRRFPTYAARTDALLAAAGVSPSLSPSLLVMDILQNTVGLLGRIGALSTESLAIAAVPACSSLAVWDDASADGTLRHARNFDFPGASVWDHGPMVVFCEPDQGLRYGFVTTRGADVPGVTAFNEAGLTLSMHTRFHRDVRFDGTASLDLGHDIVRRASTLDEALAVAREIGSGSSWGMLVSSAAERRALVIDVNGQAVCAVSPKPSEQHLACTNRYQAAALSEGEVTTSRAFVLDSDARYARLEHAVHATEDGLAAEDLEALLGDLRAPFAVDLRDDTKRLAGECIVSPITVQSIVAEPEQQRLRVSVGRAPTGFGPYVEVPWSFDGPVGLVAVREPEQQSRAMNHRGELLTTRERESVRVYVELARMNHEGASLAELHAYAERLVEREPTEPHFRLLAALLNLNVGKLETAAGHLDVALSHEGGASRRARLLLWQTRVRSALGDAVRADRCRTELLEQTGAATSVERQAAARELQKPIKPATLRRVVVDFSMIDGMLPGRRTS